MPKFLTRAITITITLFLFGMVILLYAMTHKSPEPRAINARGSDVETNAGQQPITIRVNPKQTKDEGTATIEILIRGQVQYTIQAEYDYDLWQNEHPLWYWHTDHNQDGIQDLMLQRNTDKQTYWVNGSNGKTSIIKQP